MSDVFVLVHPLCFGQQCYFQHSIQLQHHSRNVFSWKRTLKIAEIVFALFFFSIRKARSLKQDIIIFFHMSQYSSTWKLAFQATNSSIKYFYM